MFVFGNTLCHSFFLDSCGWIFCSVEMSVTTLSWTQEHPRQTPACVRVRSCAHKCACAWWGERAEVESMAVHSTHLRNLFLENCCFTPALSLQHRIADERGGASAGARSPRDSAQLDRPDQSTNILGSTARLDKLSEMKEKWQLVGWFQNYRSLDMALMKRSAHHGHGCFQTPTGENCEKRSSFVRVFEYKSFVVGKGKTRANEFDL